MIDCLLCDSIKYDYRLCHQCGEVICSTCARKINNICPYCRCYYDTIIGKKLKQYKKLLEREEDIDKRKLIYNEIGMCYIWLDHKNYLKTALEYFSKANNYFSDRNIKILKFFDLVEKDEGEEINIVLKYCCEGTLYLLSKYAKKWMKFLVSKNLVYARYYYAQTFLMEEEGSQRYFEEIKELANSDHILSKEALLAYYRNWGPKEEKIKLLKELADKDMSEYCYSLYFELEGDLPNEYLEKAANLGHQGAINRLICRNLKKKNIDKIFDVISKFKEKEYYYSKFTRILACQDLHKLKLDMDFY